MTIYGYARVSTDGQTLAAQDARTIPPLGLTSFATRCCRHALAADRRKKCRRGTRPAGLDFLHKCKVLRWVRPMWDSA
jgi:DNA invertase Pin-like site-specific DNA recombinase